MEGEYYNRKMNPGTLMRTGLGESPSELLAALFRF